MTQDSFAGIDELAASLRRGETSAVELAEQAIARIEKLNTNLSAFVSLTRERAMKEAQAADERLASDSNAPHLCGIPYAAKDIFDIEGEVTAAGCPVLVENRAHKDSAAVARLSTAGMVIVGKTRTSPLACEITGLNHSENPAINPWLLKPHIAGGSSSGSAVAVASGMVPVALGSDTGGSVRVPAALCGITGHKTTLGQVSRAGVVPLAESVDTVGSLTRNAGDAALVFDTLRGYDPLDPSTKSATDRNKSSSNLQGCRVVIAEGILFEDVEAEIEASVRDSAEVFAGLGATVEQREMTVFAEVIEMKERFDLLAGEAWRNTREILLRWGEDRDPLTDWLLYGAEIDDAWLGHCRKKQTQMQAAFSEVAVGVDFLIAPTVRETTRPIAKVEADYDAHSDRYVRNTCVGNFLNLCGLSVPCGQDSQGRPIGMMIYARPFADDRLLAFGKAFQAETAYHNIYPSRLGFA